MRSSLLLVVVALAGGCSTGTPASTDGGPIPPGPTPIAGTFCALPGTDVPDITVPAGFCVREFTTTPVVETRVMRFAPNGDLFIAAPSQGTPGGASGGPAAIIVLPDDNRDGRADAVLTYAGGGPAPISGVCAQAETNPADLSCVHGIAFAKDYVYYTRSDEVRRFPYKAGDRAAPSPSGEVVATLGGAPRWTHTLDVRNDGQVLVSRGRFEGTQCSAQEMSIGAIFALDVTKPLPVVPSLVADGFRNPMYLRCRPAFGDCFANELSGDSWGGIGGHEKLVLLQPTATHWGFPCCVAQGTAAPGGDAAQCGTISAENVVVPLHDTPFGLDFETGKFGAPYTNAAFSALHGSAGDWKGTALSWAPVDPKTHLPTGTFQVFASGWGQKNQLRGRATDVAFAPDGRLFVGDDMSGRIFWIAPRTLARP